MVLKARIGLLASLGALLLLPSASAIAIDLPGIGRLDLLEAQTACADVDPSLLDGLLSDVDLRVAACADAGPDGLDVGAGAGVRAADLAQIHAMAAADAGAQGVHAAAAAAARAADIDASAAAAADVDQDPHVAAGAMVEDVAIGPVVLPDEAGEKQGILAKIGSWIRGLF